MSKLNLGFVGIGAAKAGTTWLNTCINEHPEVICSVKEFSFFNDIGGIYDDYHSIFDRGLEWYASMFPLTNDTKSPFRYLVKKNPIKKGAHLIGEFTVDYMRDPAVPDRIKSLFPKTKIICVIRQPVERAYSHYVWYKKNFKFEKSASFEEALVSQPEYVERGLYYKHLKPYVDTFGKENVFIVIYDDIVKDPLRVVRDTYRFLGIKEDFVPRSLNRKVNRARKAKRNWMSKILLVPKFMRDHGMNRILYPISTTQLYRKCQTFYTKHNTEAYEYSLSPDLVKRLTDKYFKNDIESLEKLFKIDLSTWKN